ncbi:MAG: IS110 family transposase [Candidatus Tectomicrobia bacterium]
MKLYGGIDLHANNNVVVLLDERDQVVYQKRLPNDLTQILRQLAPYQSSLCGVVVESTYNWYWLVDGLMDAGYGVHLANTAAIQQYEGLKYTDDRSDARWLAHLLRLGVLPEGYIYPKQERAVRDLLRKRSQLVRYKTANLLSIQNLITRNTGTPISGNRIKQLTAAAIETLLPDRDLALAVQSNLAVMRCLEEQIENLEQVVRARVKLRPEFTNLHTVSGIGPILALTIMLETGEIRRFAQVGHFASYCRCVSSTKLSNRKKKGEANRRNGNKYLAWAFVEAANFAVRYHPKIQRFYQRKKAKTHGVVALKAVAHKLARACYYILRDQVPFNVEKAFG